MVGVVRIPIRIVNHCCGLTVVHFDLVSLRESKFLVCLALSLEQLAPMLFVGSVGAQLLFELFAYTYSHLAWYCMEMMAMSFDACMPCFLPHRSKTKTAHT